MASHFIKKVCVTTSEINSQRNQLRSMLTQQYGVGSYFRKYGRKPVFDCPEVREGLGKVTFQEIIPISGHVSKKSNLQQSGKVLSALLDIKPEDSR